MIVFASGLGLAAMSLWLMRGGVDTSRDAQEAYRRCDYIEAVRAYQDCAAHCHDLPALAVNQAAALYRLERFRDADGRYRIVATGEDPLQNAKAAYCRGNCAVRLACSTKAAPDSALLDQAAEQFRACLDQDAVMPGGVMVLEDAQHNLELTKLLRQPPATTNDATADPQTDTERDPQVGMRRAYYENREPSNSSAGLPAAANSSDYLCPD
jgi:hypothetical protein